jgi:hypothetical protein
MANHITRYHAMLVGVTTSVNLPNNAVAVAYFLAVTAGTISLTTKDGTVKLSAFPVTAGQSVPLLMICGPDAVFATAGGASGTLTYDS